MHCFSKSQFHNLTLNTFPTIDQRRKVDNCQWLRRQSTDLSRPLTLLVGQLRAVPDDVGEDLLLAGRHQSCLSENRPPTLLIRPALFSFKMTVFVIVLRFRPVAMASCWVLSSP